MTKIVVTHLTRVDRGSMAVAGIDIDSGSYVRPIIEYRDVEAELFATRSRPHDIATLVDLGPTEAAQKRPLVEREKCNRWRVRRLHRLSSSQFWERLSARSLPSLRDIFGKDLRPAGDLRDRAIVTPGAGIASLGCLRPSMRPTLYIDQRPDGSERARMLLADGPFALDLAVNDVRLYDDEHSHVRRDAYHAAEYRIAKRVPTILSVGLSPVFEAMVRFSGVHWLQINNLHFEDMPCWSVRDSGRGSLDPFVRALQ
jgi:hypothetical protein